MFFPRRFNSVVGIGIVFSIVALAEDDNTDLFPGKH